MTKPIGKYLGRILTVFDREKSVGKPRKGALPNAFVPVKIR